MFKRFKKPSRSSQRQPNLDQRRPSFDYYRALPISDRPDVTAKAKKRLKLSAQTKLAILLLAGLVMLRLVIVTSTSVVALDSSGNEFGVDSQLVGLVKNAEGLKGFRSLFSFFC